MAARDDTPAAQERDRLRRRLADQAMALDLLATLPTAQSPAAALDVLLDIVEELCAPAALGFFPAQETAARVYRPARKRAREAVDRTRSALAPGERWALLEEGFALELAPDVGVLVATELAFPLYRDDYLNLLVTISGAVATAMREVRAKIALTAREQRFRSLAEQSANIVFSIADDPTPHLTYVNPRLTELTGWTEATLAEQPGLFARMFAPRPALSGPTGLSMRYDVAIPCADGYTRVFEVTRVSVPGGAHGTAQDVTAERELRLHLAHRAETDSLTGLANRSHLREQLVELLAEARATDVEVEVAYLDLDGFKAINDNLGHTAGDVVLAETARRLLAALAPTDVVGRVGGDEFVVARTVVGATQSDLRELVAQALSPPLPVGQGVAVQANPSVGVVRLGPQDAAFRGLDVDAVLATADRRMYRHKRRRTARAKVPFSAPQPVSPDSVSPDSAPLDSAPQPAPASLTSALPSAHAVTDQGAAPAPPMPPRVSAESGSDMAQADVATPAVPVAPVSAFAEAPVAMMLVGVRRGASREDLVVLEGNRALLELLGFPWPNETRFGQRNRAVSAQLADDLQKLPEYDDWQIDNRALAISFHRRTGDLGWGEVGLTKLDATIADAYGVADSFTQAVSAEIDLWLLHVRDVTDQHTVEAQLAHRATHEAVTGLPNRTLLLRKLSDQLHADRAADQRTALIVLDLDDFRSVNNSLGVTGGDEYLRGVASALTDVCTDTDYVAHLGSDEFAIIHPQLTDESLAAALAEQIRTRLATGVWVGDTLITAAASLGVAISRRRTSPAALLAEADGAMHLAKSRGGNSWSFAVRSWHRNAARVVTIESDLRHAIVQGGFELRYQPIFDLAPGSALVEVEALVRWEHPKLGQMLPGDFIEVAERRNLMPELGLWVLRQACAQAAQWRGQFGVQAPAVAVNVSSKQLETGDFATDVVQALHDYRLDPEHIMLELTESQVLNASELVTERVHALADLGLRIAVDDFGTGHAGFQYLRRLPASVLKIDKTFVDRICTDDTDRAILHSVIGLGESLGLTVIAEGVETTEQLALLRKFGCHQGQGWLWRPALRAADVEAIFGVPEDQLQHGAHAPTGDVGNHPSGVPGRT